MRKNGRKLLALLAVLCLVITMVNSSVVSHATEAGGSTENSAANNGFLIDSTGALVGYSGAGGDVVVPSNVTTVASGVFAGNTTITSVTLPSSVAVIGTGVFANCTSLTAVSIQGNISTIPTQTFYNCENLKSIYVPTSVASIGAEAFAECVSLSGITIPGSVVSIGDRAFYNCISLGGVAIPASVSSIGNNSFLGCSNMTSYSVDAGNGHYASDGGCLYNKTMTKLLNCPEGRSSANIAKGTKIIGSKAFYNCGAIHALVLPESITTIESNAFAKSGINDITILSNVTSIASQGGWTASIIYGESDSAAEVFANSNSIVFQALNTSPEPPTETEQETEADGGDKKGDNKKPQGGGADKNDNDNNKNDAGSDNNNAGSGNSGSTGNSGTNTGNTAGSGSTSSNKTYNTGTAYSSGAASSAANAAQKDSTPKTGDGVNPVFFFCFAFLMLGVCLLLFGKKKTA